MTCNCHVRRARTPEDYEKKAAELWLQFNENERHGVRFGLFPHHPTMTAEKDGYDGRELAVALMKHDKRQRGIS